MKSKHWTIFTLIFTILLSGCSLPNMGASNANIDINITSPLPQSQFALGETITIQSIVGASSGAEKIELLANEEVIRSDELNAPLTQGKMTQGWLPEVEGIYALQTRATTASGEVFSSNIVTVAVVGITSQLAVPTTASTAEVVATATLPPTKTSVLPTATTTLMPSVTPLASPIATTNQTATCYSGPGYEYDNITYLEQNQSAPIIGWNVEGTWWLLENVNGHNCWVWYETVGLSGDASNIPVVAAPPTPTAAPLPAPTTLNPIGALSCRSSVFIDWVPVDHPNGIARYEWEITGTGTDTYTSETATSIEYFVTCGMSYSWRVRAVDGFGNIGPYSEEVFFSIE